MPKASKKIQNAFKNSSDLKQRILFMETFSEPIFKVAKPILRGTHFQNRFPEPV